MTNFLDVVQQKVKLVEERRNLITSSRFKRLNNRFINEGGLRISFVFLDYSPDHERKAKLLNMFYPYISFREHIGSVTRYCIINENVGAFILSPLFIPYFGAPYSEKFLRNYKLRKKKKYEVLWSFGVASYVVPFRLPPQGEDKIEVRFQCMSRDQLSIFQDMYDYIVYDRKRMNGTFIE